MNQNSFSRTKLFDEDSVDESDDGEYSESSVSSMGSDSPKLFLASLSTMRLNYSIKNAETPENQDIQDNPSGNSTGKQLSKEDLLQEVAMKSSYRRILPESSIEKGTSSHSLFKEDHDETHTETPNPISPQVSLNVSNETSSELNNMATNNELADKMEMARSYINIHASTRKFSGFVRNDKKQISDEARMQSHMLMNIFVNRRELNASRFPRNVFITSKYTVWNFLFRNLFEQFSRIANFVFLLVTLVQLIPGVSPFNIWSTLTPLIFILLVTALKEAWEDYGRHKADAITNNIQYQRVMRDGTICNVPSCELVAGDIIVLKDQESIPADVLVLSCSDSDGTCYVDTSSLDGETNLKEKQAVELTKSIESPSDLGSLVGTLTCQIPNKELSIFQGVLSLHTELDQSSPTSIVEEAVTSQNLLLRGSILRNSNWVTAMVVYTGRLTKLSLNTNISKFKFSGIETSLNSFVPKVLFLQLALSLISCSVARIYDETVYELGLKTSIRPFFDFIFDFLTFFILFSYFVPMSLYVVFEFSRSIQAFFMENDLDMYVENEGGMHVSTSSLNEELGNVEFILSDKTGTLTKNNMTCYGFCMGGYVFKAHELTTLSNPKEVIIQVLAKENSYDTLSEMETEYVIHFLRSLFLCNSIKPVEKDGEIVLRSESADEEALIDGGLKLGWKLLLHTKDSIVIQEGYPFLPENTGQSTDGYHKFEILEELPFTSSRQRMTIIVRDTWSNRICLYSKGADSRILSLSCDEDILADNNLAASFRSSIFTSSGDIDLIEEEREQMLQRVASFTKMNSQQGYRLLLVGGKYITEEEYAEWKIEIEEAKKSMKNREEAIERAFLHIERDMSVLGATAVEDELQDYIKEDIEILRNGGITVAMATGDKKETALIIAKNCGLLTEAMSIFDLTGTKNASLEQLEKALTHSNYQKYLKKLEYDKKNKGFLNSLMNCCFKRPQTQDSQSSQSSSSTIQPYALVLDGLSADYLIRFAQDKLAYAIKNAATVICSRMSPKQKSRIIILMKNQGLCCLAIGDGANDVSMIRESSVGIGVKGKEGNAAVNNADYIIRRFHHLIKLLFVHGRNNYRGNSYSVYTAFYENITFNIPLFFINFYTMFSGQTIYSSFELSTLYFFTCPTFASFGFFFCDLAKQTLLSHPEIYHMSKQEKMFSGTRMWSYLIGATVNAMVNGYIPLLIFNEMQTIQGGYPLEFWSMGFCIWSDIIFSIIIMSAMNVPKWNWNYLTFFIIAILFFFIDTLAILWVVQDELYDSLPIIIRSPVYYLQLLFSMGVVFIFFFAKTALSTAFNPEIWRPYAEMEAIEKKATATTKLHPLESVSTMN